MRYQTRPEGRNERRGTRLRGPQHFHWEIKGQSPKRVVLANVPSFRFSFWGNIRTYPCSGFPFRGNIRMCPRSGFRSGGASAKTTLLETTLLCPSESVEAPWGDRDSTPRSHNSISNTTRLRGPLKALRGRVCPPPHSQRSGRERRWAVQRSNTEEVPFSLMAPETIPTLGAPTFENEMSNSYIWARLRGQN